jgi:hypothetical protein
MPTLPAELMPLIVEFAPLFSKPVWAHAKVLLAGAILALGKRTVTSCLRMMGLIQEIHFQNYHRVCATPGLIPRAKIKLNSTCGIQSRLLAARIFSGRSTLREASSSLIFSRKRVAKPVISASEAPAALNAARSCSSVNRPIIPTNQRACSTGTVLSKLLILPL